MDVDLLSGGQRHHLADDGLAGEYVWTQAPADGFSHWLHDSVIFLWSCPVVTVSDHLPYHSRSVRWRFAAIVSGDSAGGISSRKTRPGDGILGARHCGCPHARPSGWGLVNGQLQLALGFLHQHSAWYPGHHAYSIVRFCSVLSAPDSVRD